jgi:hypothetical protein
MPKIIRVPAGTPPEHMPKYCYSDRQYAEESLRRYPTRVFSPIQSPVKAPYIKDVFMVVPDTLPWDIPLDPPTHNEYGEIAP